MQLHLPTHVQSYTGGIAELTLADAPTLAELFVELDARYPGLRFRVIDEQGALRPHFKLFVNGEIERAMTAPLPTGAEVVLVAALSGG
ncbi:MoaD/ThiS family protein [Pseudomonas sp. R5(2019)]|uniref:MoaD/ThiS family protein n=1 Tax=Pseudomonas sp. R5(2019) TaxID=2697566 RepID=UPI001412A84A|nr:MoaD/ThiS family protein [Pseudomonas sp. R5(2019)]NBA97587.1 MoaD/ThiS family protein [Pseudomonas sp. R5(2019)]